MQRQLNKVSFLSKLIPFVCISLFYGAFMALSKQTILLINQSIDPNHYIRLAHSATRSDINHILDPIAHLEIPLHLSICSVSNYPSTFYILEKVYAIYRESGTIKEIDFPSRTDCQNLAQSPAFGNPYIGCTIVLTIDAQRPPHLKQSCDKSK